VRIAALALVASLFLALPASAQQSSRCPGGRPRDAAMWLSIAHPGLGEWYLKGWGNFWDNVPPRKFWLGFIPGYGWPGYLQVKSAIDARRCETHDELTFRD